MKIIDRIRRALGTLSSQELASLKRERERELRAAGYSKSAAIAMVAREFRGGPR